MNNKIKNLYLQGKSCAEIANLYNCSETFIYNKLKSLGIIIRSRSEANQIFPSFIFVTLYNMGLSSSQIGRLLGIDSSTVTKRLHSIKFPLRFRDVAFRIRYTNNEFKKYFMNSNILTKLENLINKS